MLFMLDIKLIMEDHQVFVLLKGLFLSVSLKHLTNVNSLHYKEVLYRIMTSKDLYKCLATSALFFRSKNDLNTIYIWI